MRKKILASMLAIIVMLLVLCACGGEENPDNSVQSNVGVGNSENVTANEDFFVWDGNYISALTEAGAKETNLTIPARCEGFTDAVFVESSAKKVVFEDDDNIDLGLAFMGAEQLQEVQLPDGLTTISMMSFQMCEDLRTITIPQATVELGAYAFNGCKNLTEVHFAGESIMSIDRNCFEDCSSIVSVVIPDGVTSIGEYAFNDCTSLAEVTLAASVSSVDKFAFGNTALTEIDLPEAMEISYMDASAFGTNAYSMTVYIAAGSWCDTNKEAWDIGFASIVAE